MENENDQYSSKIRANREKRNFEILQAEIILFSPLSKVRSTEMEKSEVISFSNEKILQFKFSSQQTRSHLRLIKTEDQSTDNILQFQ